LAWRELPRKLAEWGRPCSGSELWLPGQKPLTATAAGRHAAGVSQKATGADHHCSALRQRLCGGGDCKHRLGYSDTSLTWICARALAESGAPEIALHARTKMEGYKRRALRMRFARIREVLDVPVIPMAKYGIWRDHQRITELSGCDR